MGKPVQRFCGAVPLLSNTRLLRHTGSVPGSGVRTNVKDEFEYSQKRRRLNFEIKVILQR